MKATNESNADEPFDDGDAAVLADCAEAALHFPSGQQVAERVGGEDGILIADEMPGSAVLSEGLFHRVYYPSDVGAF